MKFKTKNEILKMISNDVNTSQSLVKTHDKGYEVGFNCAIEFAFTSFKERIDLYKKYKNRRNKFQEKYPKAYKKYTPTIHAKGTITYVCFDTWLFSYCFGDI